MSHAYLGAPSLHVIQRCKKIPYPSRNEAIKALKKMGDGKQRAQIQPTPGKLTVYECRSCRKTWHIGHMLKGSNKVTHVEVE